MASSESPTTPLSLLMTKDDFDRPDILNAANPHPESGYAHGMHAPKAKRKKKTVPLCSHDVIIRSRPEQ